MREQQVNHACIVVRSTFSSSLGSPARGLRNMDEAQSDAEYSRECSNTQALIPIKFSKTTSKSVTIAVVLLACACLSLSLLPHLKADEDEAKETDN